MRAEEAEELNKLAEKEWHKLFPSEVPDPFFIMGFEAAYLKEQKAKSKLEKRIHRIKKHATEYMWHCKAQKILLTNWSTFFAKLLKQNRITTTELKEHTSTLKECMAKLKKKPL